MILAIVQARCSSSRLPGKVLLPLMGAPMLQRQLERLRNSQTIDNIVVATSDEVSDDTIEKLCQTIAVDCYRGSLNDVLDRFYQTTAGSRPDHIVRITGDCPLLDHRIVDLVVRTHLEHGNDYTSNTLTPMYPDGMDVEVFTYSALETAWREARLGWHREHVTPYINTNPTLFRLENINHNADLSGMRWTVDEIEDYNFVCQIYEGLYIANNNFGMNDVIHFLTTRPQVSSLNQQYKRNEGLLKSIRNE